MITPRYLEASQLLYSTESLSIERLVFWIVIIAIADVIGGTYAFAKGLKSFPALRLIENIPTSKVRSMALGLVEIKGRTIPYSVPLKAPFSEVLCVYYQIEIFENVGDSSAKVFKEESHDRFYLEDETGKVLISPARAALEIERVHTYSDAEGMPFNAEKKLEALGLTPFSGMRGSMSIKEYVIGVEQEIYILGTAALLRNETSSLEPGANLIIRKGTNDPFFLISDRSEKQLRLTRRFWIRAGIFGGPILAVAGLAILTYLIFIRPDLLRGFLNSRFKIL